MAAHRLPMPDRDDDTGRYTDEYPDEDFLQALSELGGAAGTQDVADEVGCIYDTAYKKLRRLEEDGQIESQKVANARLWMLTDGEDGG